MDAYHAPYSKETRYWTGLILSVRCILFLTFVLNSFGNANVNLLAITSVTAGLAALAWVHKGIYKNIYNDILESFFILNLCIFAAVTYHMKETGGSQAAGLADTSVGISFATFICIVLYHIYLGLHKMSLWRKLLKRNDENYFNMHWFGQNKETQSVAYEDGQPDGAIQAPTITIIDLREPLLEN